jgi:hypothetical protein
MRKTIFLLALVVVFASCSKSTPTAEKVISLAGTWTGTTWSAQNGTQRLDLTINQSASRLSGTWASGLGIGGNFTGSISGRDVQASLTSPSGYTASLVGTVNSSGTSASGSGTDWGGTFTFNIRKI